MVYFDTAYIAKCYLNEPGAETVRQFAYNADGLASSELARVEFYSVVHRHLREGSIDSQEAQEVERLRARRERRRLGLVWCVVFADKSGM